MSIRKIQLKTPQDLIIPYDVMHEMLHFGQPVQASELDYQPALVGPKALKLLMLSRVQQLQEQEHPAHARWRRGADLPLHDDGMRSLFDRSMVTMGQ